LLRTVPLFTNQKFRLFQKDRKPRKPKEPVCKSPVPVYYWWLFESGFQYWQPDHQIALASKLKGKPKVKTSSIGEFHQVEFVSGAARCLPR
jgi:hypothetical protein